MRFKLRLYTPTEERVRFHAPTEERVRLLSLIRAE
jgi:hypothetical protein